MISTKCDKFKDKAWCWSCNDTKANLYHILYVMKL